MNLDYYYCHWGVYYKGLPCGSDGEESSCNAGDRGSIPEPGRSLQKRMATHSSILAWRIPWTEESGGLQPMRSKSQTQVSNSAHTVFIINACSREAPHVENPYWEPIICIAANITSDVSGCLGRLKKQRHYFANKGLSSQGYDFSSSHVWM